MMEFDTGSCSPGPEDLESTSTAPMLAVMQKIWPTAVVTVGQCEGGADEKIRRRQEGMVTEGKEAENRQSRMFVEDEKGKESRRKALTKALTTSHIPHTTPAHTLMLNHTCTHT